MEPISAENRSALTKTAYLAYTQCPKQFWLAEHHPELTAPPDPAIQRRLQASIDVDRLALGQFPDGVHIPYRPHPEDMAPITAQAIVEGAKAFFQATFTVDDLLVKVDILAQQAQNNTIDNFKYGFDELFLSKLIGRMEDNQEIFARIMDDEEFGTLVRDWKLRKVYQRLNAEPG